MKNEYDNLREAILLLKKKRRIERNLLNENFQDTLESIKPINLIKGLFTQKSFNELGGSSSIIDTLMGLATGYISKKTFVGGSHNLFKNGLGMLLQMGIQNLTISNSDTIKVFGKKILQSIFKKKPEDELETLYR
ncbi:hypothetical protein [Cytophaga hutchinsonii]|jgi:hypothetical protein|uniref:Uncharacterized protein n=1 Tax=Cytophaga hutchinsonii (strain ATCC 33406 / DSM 1761 / CIP 103989 / NBRC 15051 / NCIMB 9469 / D465) TaxID=269798 RepID=A0A6N4SW67_CYTH3|nr:hypothetical protein [Cytophaga hutchinsonii]ABG60787.1 hypothetical protein CHU_3554 [Cytophaga hutchinsonii ATCC 33406]SFX71930.1 hypothetical protein SAMN04487930_108112 [Cytophaga hutchinsonii ATCC 33406]